PSSIQLDSLFDLEREFGHVLIVSKSRGHGGRVYGFVESTHFGISGPQGIEHSRHTAPRTFGQPLRETYGLRPIATCSVRRSSEQATQGVKKHVVVGRMK